MKTPVRNGVKDIWLKASVVGSLWASVEIIAGSFFHNLRIPMAGTILAMISVMIMVAFHQIWKEKGLFWRAGLICALMKSISPSALLLGPMTGIFAEAVLMEMATRLFGGNIFGYLLGGSLALVSTLAHKIVNLLFLYGFDFVTVLMNLYHFAVKQIGFPNLKPELALWVLIGIYVLMGIFATVNGYLLGKRALRLKSGKDDLFSFELNPSRKLFETGKSLHFSVKLLFFHLFTLAACLVMINNFSFYIAIMFISAYLAFCIIHYKNSLRHLKKPFFWVQVVVLTFLATLFFNGFEHGNIFDAEGLMVGIKMNVRAVLVLIAFSSISVEMRNPVVKSVLWKRGLSQLYQSLSLAFAALPSVISNLPKPGRMVKHPINSLSEILVKSGNLLELFKQGSLRPKVFIISGEKHQGKTTWVRRLIDILNQNKNLVGGFVAPGKFEKNQRSEFGILDLKSGKSKVLSSINFTEGESIGPFRFSEEGQNFGKEILKPENLRDCRFVVIDEIGPLEMKNEGWAPSIDVLMAFPEITHIWVVRKNLVNEVIKKWQLFDVNIFDIAADKVEDVFSKIGNS
jgi:nucleoside-triphosphatase THEP1